MNRTTARLGAGGLTAVVGAALVAFTGLATAHAAGEGPAVATNHPLLDGKWNGKSDTNSGAGAGDCDYSEIKTTHTGIGWHFVLPGNVADMSSFTAHFLTAGDVQVTTTETSKGVIVQGGKGAVIYTPTHDTLTASSTWTDENGQHAGQAVNNGASDHYLQLSHICDKSASPTPTPTDSESPTPTPTNTKSESPSVNPTSATQSPDIQVEGEHASRAPATSVNGTKAANLPTTGQETQRLLTWV